MNRLLTLVKHEPLVIAGVIVSAVLLVVNAMSTSTDHSVSAWIAVAIPVLLGVAGRFVTEPRAVVQPLADFAAEITAQVNPSRSGGPLLILSALHSAAAQVAATGFPAPITDAPAVMTPAPIAASPITAPPADPTALPVA